MSSPSTSPSPFSEEVYEHARFMLAWMPQHGRDQLKAQAAEYGCTLLDLTADFVARCMAGEE